MSSTGPLADALAKLTQAVDAAESAVEDRARASAADAATRKDSTKLESEFGALKRDHAALKAVADDVAGRLDGAIGQVESILAGRA